MKNISTSRARDYAKIFYPKPMSPMNAPTQHVTTKKRRQLKQRLSPAKAATPNHRRQSPSLPAQTTPVTLFSGDAGAGATPIATPPTQVDEEVTDFSQDPAGAEYETEYSFIEDEALVDLVASDHEATAASDDEATAATTPSQARVHSEYTSSFPSSPPPSLSATPTFTPLAQYTPTEYTPVWRDYAMDYEACLTAVQDFNSLGRIIHRGSMTGANRYNLETPEVVTREDVLTVLTELRDMINRLFERLRD